MGIYVEVSVNGLKYKGLYGGECKRDTMSGSMQRSVKTCYKIKIYVAVSEKVIQYKDICSGQ